MVICLLQVICCSIVNQISEYEIIEISENVCNLKKQEADWILKIDIVEQGDRLEVRMIFLVSLLLRYTWIDFHLLL